MSNSSKENVNEEIDKDEKNKQIDFYKKTISEQRENYKKIISDLLNDIFKLNSTIDSKNKEIEDLKSMIDSRMVKDRLLDRYQHYQKIVDDDYNG